MNRLAIIGNPKSHRNLRGSALKPDLPKCPFFIGLAEPETQAELLAALTRFKQQGAEILAVNGGDGTLRDVLTALWRIDPAWRPALSLIPGGKTNLAAYDVGCVPHGPGGLQQILDAASQNRLDRHRVSRAVLDITRSDDPGQTICGMFFGAGAFSAATELARHEANALGLYHGLAVAWTIGSMLARNLFSRGGDATPMILTTEAGRVLEGDQFILLATSSQRLVMGLKPFWGDNTGAIRYTAIAGPPAGLARALLPILRGRPKPWMLDAGYHSGSADRLDLQLASPFTVDGELFDPGPSGRIEISAHRRFDFVHP